MTRQAAMKKVKKDDASSNRNSSSSYSDDDQESQETEVSDASDLSSDSDISEFDKNNNRSPPPTHKFLQQLDCNELYSQSRRNMATSQEHREELVKSRQSYEANGTSSADYFSNEGDEYSYSPSKVFEDDVFIHSGHDEDFMARYSRDESMRARQINANENNNSNRKRFRNMNSASYNFGDKNTAFRSQARSVQLSSVRATRGKYKSNRMIPYKERMICKNGESNVKLKKFGKWDSATRYSKDIFTTLIDLHWTWVILLTALVYIGHWIIFGAIYWIFAFVNDDFAKIFGSDDLVENATLSATLENQQPCVSGVYDFVSAFLFSMESETTIGYGSRTIGTSCKGAIAVLVIQCVISAIFDTWVIGMCFSRMARPDARCKTILYSKNAVICTRDGKKCLIVRVGNLRKSLLLAVSCRARIITLRAPHYKEEEEGHEFMLEQKELNFENANITMLTAPVEYCHVIDKDSPLYSIPARYISSDDKNWFEVVIILTGIVEATGMTVHAQTSYLSTEIKYRHRLVPVISLSPKKDRYLIDFDKFHQIEPESLAVAKMNRRNKNAKLLDGRFDALMEESDEYSDVFPSSDVCKTLGNSCKFCGKCMSGDNNMNQACDCDRGIDNGMKQIEETKA